MGVNQRSIGSDGCVAIRITRAGNTWVRIFLGRRGVWSIQPIVTVFLDERAVVCIPNAKVTRSLWSSINRIIPEKRVVDLVLCRPSGSQWGEDLFSPTLLFAHIEDVGKRSGINDEGVIINKVRTTAKVDHPICRDYMERVIINLHHRSTAKIVVLTRVIILVSMAIIKLDIGASRVSGRVEGIMSGN